MRSRSERRSRQKAGRPRPASAIDDYCNLEDIPQYFQISVGVLEAGKLSWSNHQSANSYVVVVLGKKKYRTTLKRNMVEPFYGEYFVFEMYDVSIRDVQRSNISLAVMEPRFCTTPRLLGESIIDLGTIWAEPYHQIYHKWAQLTLPQGAASGSAGFLKVDIAIMFRGERQIMPSHVGATENVFGNVFLPTGSEQQRANYLITLYAASGLPSATYGQGGNRHGKPPSTFVQVSFCGLMAKTAVQYRTINPMYCEQISMVEMFPNMSQGIRLEVCLVDGCFNRVLASTDLQLAQISHDGENGFLPAFGPSLLHMYGSAAPGIVEGGPFHRGALLVSLKTIVPYYQQEIRSINVEPAMPITPESLWDLDDFCIFCPIFEVSMLDRCVTGKLCGVAITMGENILSYEKKADDEFTSMMQVLKSRKLHYTGSIDVMKTKPYGFLNFPNAFPVLQLATELPDFRFRMYRNNMVYGMVRDLESSLSDVDYRLKTFDYATPDELVDELNKAVDDAIGSILKYLDIMKYSSHAFGKPSQQYTTELDQKIMGLQKEEIEKIYNQLSRKRKGESDVNLIADINATTTIPESRKGVKLLLAEIKSVVQSLRNIIYKTYDGWPDIVIWLLNEGSRAAFTKISTADIIYSVIPEQCGQFCGRIQTVYIKPLKCPKHNTLRSGCYCVAGKIELLLWMGLFRQKNVFETFLPTGYTLKCRDYDMCIKCPSMMVECRVFIHKARLACAIEASHTLSPFIRVNALNTTKETNVEQKTLLPIWNQVIRIQGIMFTTPDRLALSPPIVLIEAYDEDSVLGKAEFIGRFQIQPVIDERQGYEYAPKLQWHDIYKGTEHTGQILMSAQLLPVPEMLLRNTVYAPTQETYCVPGVKEFDLAANAYEPLPSNLVPRTLTYKMDIYWWGLRDVTVTRKPCVVLELDELTIKSDIIAERKANCNFPNGRMTQIFKSPMNGAYSSPLTVKLNDISTFGRTIFLGAKVITNPTKYVVNWLPKSEREESLKSLSITSPNFYQVSQMLFVKKISQTVEDKDVVAIDVTLKKFTSKSKIKRRSWLSLCCKKEPKEEEYALLPVYEKEKDQVLKKSCKFIELKDWWLRYYVCSQRNNYSQDETDSFNDEITIYNSELENQPQFSRFKDWCTTLKLNNGKQTGYSEKDDQYQCGSLKVGIAIYKWPPPSDTVPVNLNGVDLNKGFFNDYPSNDPLKFLVRVYLVKGLNLRAKELVGKSDPYAVVICGKKHLGDRTSYVENTADPIFGKLFEFRCSLPEEYLVTVSVYDYEAIPPDELIGSTCIDVEDRIYSKHRARVGLPSEYSVSGPYNWRDIIKPSVILEEVCAKNNIPTPLYFDNKSVLVNGVEYRDNGQDKTYASASERKENICLGILKRWHTMPLCGYNLVPEHVETRTLYHPDKPGMQQGKIQLWVDIFPIDANLSIPLPTDISSRKPQDFELRVIVWDVNYMTLQSCEKIGTPRNVYVKAWIGSEQQGQQTDVHQNSINGIANFNWRMIFHFTYQHAERKLIHKEQGPFTEYEEYVMPILAVQLSSDNDDFLGLLSLNLNDIPCGTKQASQCTLKAIEKAKIINLFSQRAMRAWWPLKVSDLKSGNELTAGVIDLELTLLPKEKAAQMSVGLGRKGPSPLPQPERPVSTGNVSQTCAEMIKIIYADNTAIVIVIATIIVIMMGLLFFGIPTWINCFNCSNSHCGHQRHAEGIIRTLYPIEP